VAILCQKYFGLSMPPNNVLKIVDTRFWLCVRPTRMFSLMLNVFFFYLPSPSLAK
jgi:hypothetical protein